MVSYRAMHVIETTSVRLNHASFRGLSDPMGLPIINPVSLRYYRWAASLDLACTADTKAYLDRLDPCETLDAKDERNLLVAFHAARCIMAFATLEASQRHLVVSIAGRFADRGLPKESLLLLAHQGLLNAIMTIDPEEGRRLSSWAVWPITSSLRAAFKAAQPELLIA